VIIEKSASAEHKTVRKLIFLFFKTTKKSLCRKFFINKRFLAFVLIKSVSGDKKKISSRLFYALLESEATAAAVRKRERNKKWGKCGLNDLETVLLVEDLQVTVE
jgi:hypothetical protein